MNGVLVLDKPAGATSHDCVYAARRATGVKSIGHLGTLDPMATGVLPLLVGKYTRLAQFFGSAAKSYEGTIRFGWATDTYDADGDVVGERRELTLGLEELRGLAERFHGVMEQMPPAFSAKKIKGVPAYKLARAGKPVEVKPVQIEIVEFKLSALTDGAAEFRMTVSAGGYVRSVAQELGQLAGCGAHLATLRRVRAGAFGLEQAVTVEELRELDAEMIAERFVPLRTLLPEMPSVTVDAETAGRIRNGMAVNVPEYSTAERVKVFANATELIAIARRIAGTLVQPEVVVG
jgi:tRNA pseudouridine55 synthase